MKNSMNNRSSEWLKQKVDIEGEYRSNSEAVNDLIRKAREIEGIRARPDSGRTEWIYRSDPGRDTR